MINRFTLLLTVALLLTAAGATRSQTAAGARAYPPSCFETGQLPTFAASYVEGTISFDYAAILADATNPRGFASQVQIRSWRVPCHTNGSALLIRVTSSLGLPIAPQVLVEQGDASVQVRLASEANTRGIDDSGRQMILNRNSVGLLLVEANDATAAAGIDFDDELTLVIRDAQFDRTLAYPAYDPAEYGVAANQVISARHGGTWFDPARDGEGLFLEIVSQPGGSRAVALSWYTYLAGQQQWLIGSAPLPVGARSISVPLIRTAGADFGAGFDPAAVTRSDWGAVTLSFSDCNRLTVSYEGVDGDGVLHLTRLTALSGLGC
ncbi:MAG: hypothetical protein AAGA23_04700 [Pseudomonadota bacterium]